VLLGASPRASLALLKASKSHAVLQGKPFVTPDDVRAVCRSVLAHRLVLVPELESDTGARTAIVEEALSRVSYQKAARRL
jgi:MoxR-like ATPase